MTFNVVNGVIRFRKAPYRFRVTKNNVSVYVRDRYWGVDTEYVVNDFEAKVAKQKNAKLIKEAKQAILEAGY